MILSANGDAIPATPPMHGLQASATEVTTPTRWESGASFCPENCTEVAGWNPDCESWPGGVKPDKADPPARQNCYEVQPFVLETAFDCDAQGFKVLDYAGRARRQAEAGTSKGMELELWTATIVPTNPSLDNGAVILGAGAPFPLLQGIAILGQALSNCAHGGRGMIHAPTWIVDMWLGQYGTLFNTSGNRIVTANRGDVIVSGTGYPGTGEDGLDAAEGTSWVYATGPINYRVGDVIVFPDTLAEAIDIRRNDVEYRAERMALVNFDTCCHFGILIDPGV